MHRVNARPSQPRGRARRWCWTLNNWTPEQERAIVAKAETPGTVYLCYGREEAPTTGTPHLQGYVEWANAKTFNAATKWFDDCEGAHPYLARARGSQKQNVTYCSKDKEAADFCEFGERNEQGSRTDIAELLEAVKEGQTDIQLADNYPEAFAKYYKMCQHMRAEYNTASGREYLARKYQHVILRSWQIECLARLDAQGDRIVLWVKDESGNRGKTWLALYLVHTEHAYYVQHGKAADIAFAFKNQEVVVFDYTRSKQETASYEMMEAFKNGSIFSPKYQSISKVFKPCKVVVFANWEPDWAKLSQDRWEFMNLDDPEDSFPPVEVVDDEAPPPLERSNAGVIDESV